MAVNLKKLVKIFTDRTQTVENVLNDLILERSLTLSIGEQLNQLGTILGLLRGGLDDEDYRDALSVQIFLDASKATPETIINAVILAVDGELAVEYSEFYPAVFEVFINTATLPNELVEAINKIKPAGVLGILICAFNGDWIEFTDNGVEVGDGLPFDELNFLEGGLPVGGAFAELLTT